MSDLQITVTKNGPYVLQGPVQLIDADGAEVRAPGDTIALCRCGGSKNKPFCDGSHLANGFDGTVNPANKAG